MKIFFKDSFTYCRENILLFENPRSSKTLILCAVGQELILYNKKLMQLRIKQIVIIKEY